jgi:N-formylmaleamate deformylase
MVIQNPQAEIVRNYPPLASFVPSRWQTGTINAGGGAHVHFTRTGGDKPSVLLLHGIQVSGLSWLRTAIALESNYDVVMPDLRGHGKSSRLAGAPEDFLLSDVFTLIRALKLENPFVVGHSMGADVAGRIAAAVPVRGLVFVDPALRNFAAAMAFDMDNPPPWMQALFDSLRALKSMSHEERMMAGLSLMQGNSTWDAADYVSYIDGQAEFDLEFYRLMMKGSASSYLFEAAEVLAKITCPTLLLTARPMMGGDIQSGVDAFMQKLPNAQHIHFEDSGHAIMFDQFDRFVEVLTGFLSEH